MSDQIQALVRQAIEDKIFPGCVLGVYRADGQTMGAFGRPTYESDSCIDTDSIYDVASLTKTIVTATLMHLLLDAGRCHLKDPVCKHIPEFAANGKGDVLIEHLLSYTLLLSYPYVDDWKGDMSLWPFTDLLTMFIGALLKAPPGEQYLYTDSTAMLLGELIRRVTGEDLDILADEMIFAPLGMHDSTLTPAKSDKSRIVPTEYRPDGQLVWSAPHDEKAYVAYMAGTHSGLAGLFTTAPDILRWVQMIFDEGMVRGKRFLSKKAIELMTTDYYPEKPFRSALGWGDGPTFLSMSGIGGQKLLVKGGFTGCFMVGDMETKTAVVFISNRVYPRRPENTEPWKEFRRDVVRSVFGI